ncbi:MAG: hypothetical protein PF448_09675 [Bacteroidales bacterium]|jgi:hypothetical protein|nr:hypothetical protein [Bacteroidales bacterium]
MKAIKFLSLSLVFFIYLILSIPFIGCETEEPDECDTCSVAYKPNIYIFPQEDIQLLVTLSFPKGGKLLTTIPEYGNGWNVQVDTSGLINDTYSYLFYESTQPNLWQYSKGWVIQLEALETFFKENLAEYGFGVREIDDFIEYWIPRLTDYEYFSIYPQTKNTIDELILLSISVQPDNMLRLFYVIEGSNQAPDQLPEPIIHNFDREGYYVTEWGVIL